MARWVILLAAAVGAIGAEAAIAQEDPFLSRSQLGIGATFRPCQRDSMAMVEKGACLGRVAERLRRDLKIEVGKRLVEIDGVADEPPAAGVLSGKEAAERWRRDFQSAQGSWEAYTKRQCQNAVDYDHYGGSGGYQYALACEIRHLVARLNEIRQ